MLEIARLLLNGRAGPEPVHRCALAGRLVHAAVGEVDDVSARDDVGGLAQAFSDCDLLQPIIREQQPDPIRLSGADALVDRARKTARRVFQHHHEVRVGPREAIQDPQIGRRRQFRSDDDDLGRDTLRERRANGLIEPFIDLAKQRNDYRCNIAHCISQSATRATRPRLSARAYPAAAGGAPTGSRNISSHTSSALTSFPDDASLSSSI